MEKFTQNLVIGIEEIDGQHKAIFNFFNELYDSIHNKTEGYNLEKAFFFLKDYVVFHFSREEEYMQKYSYPEYEYHKSQHEHFIEQLEQKQREFLLAGESVKIELLVWLYFWFKKHILSVDKTMGAFLQHKMGQPQDPSGQ
jgi:hemerythrin